MTKDQWIEIREALIEQLDREPTEDEIISAYSAGIDSIYENLKDSQ